jgi:hypothetical protein
MAVLGDEPGRVADGVPGRIHVVTPEPIAVAAHPGALAPLGAAISRRPWIFPAALLGSAAAYLLLRHR